ncbi:MAG: hypothetical protein SFU27_05475, partial [Thermonemataceae bacterium]|nr:hypothetical protein [Thermonemataceae bacterium]
LTYQAKFLNNADNAENYLGTSQKTALNLGVYLVDLGYNSLYLKSQEGLKYLKSVKKLSDQLNILDDQTKSMLTRFESNLENRDSLLTIAREGYFTIDNYLHKNERKDASAYILVGSWIEGLYLGTSLVKENPNFATDEKYKPILWRIGGQKESLNNLISLLNKFDKNNHKDLIAKLEELKKIYESVKIEQGEADSEELLDIAEIQNSDELSEKVMMKTLKKVEISKENVEKIAEKVTEIRKMITEK